MIEFEDACRDIASQGIALMGERYDAGPEKREYHNSQHGNDVYKAADILGGLALENGNISEEERFLLLPAAGYHDVLQATLDDQDELHSAHELADAMNKHDYAFKQRQITRTGELILATVAHLDNGKLVQSPAEDDYAAKLLCDADVSNIGMRPDDAVERGLALFKEIYRQPLSTNGITMSYLYTELNLLKGHRFYTSEAQEEYCHQQGSIESIKSKMRSFCVQ